MNLVPFTTLAGQTPRQSSIVAEHVTALHDAAEMVEFRRPAQHGGANTILDRKEVAAIKVALTSGGIVTVVSDDAPHDAKRVDELHTEVVDKLMGRS